MSIRPVPSRLALAAAVVVLVAGLAACSSSGDDNAAPSSSNSAVAGSPSTVAAAFDRIATATGNAKSVKGTLTTTTQLGEVDGTFALKYTDAGVLASFAVDQGGQNVKGIITPSAIYVGGGALPLPAGKSFLKIDTTASGPLAEGYRAITKTVSQVGDLEDNVAEWKSIANIEEAGTESIGGVTATKYTGTIDPKNPPAGSSAAAKSAYADLASSGVTSVDVTIWVGPDGLPLKFESKSVGGDKASTTTVTYSDWGSAVEVEVPTDAQVADAGSLLGG